MDGERKWLHTMQCMCVQRAGAKDEGRKEREVTLQEGTVVLRLECRRLSLGVEGAGAVLRYVGGKYSVSTRLARPRDVFSFRA